LSFIAVVAGLLLMRRDELTVPDPVARGAGQLRAGLAYVRDTPKLLVPLALLASVGLVAYNFALLLALLGRATFALGTGSVIFKALASTWLQLTSAPEMRGRVLALLVVAIGGTTPIGAPLMGWIAEQIGTRATFVVAGALTAIAAMVALVFLRRMVEHTDETHHSSLSRAR
jgi:predicted MFS family arabinose efflux permease